MLFGRFKKITVYYSVWAKKFQFYKFKVFVQSDSTSSSLSTMALLRYDEA